MGENIIDSKKKYCCKICSRSYIRKDTLRSHILVIHEVGGINCSYCRKCFAFPAQLKRHLRIHTKAKPFKCDWFGCAKKFNVKDILTRHVETVHKKIKSFKCRKCGKAFGQNGHLRRHTRTHSGEKPYKSDICNKRFCQVSNRNSHKLTIH